MIDPVSLIVELRTRARERGDPLADLCFLATVTDRGGPSVRTIVLRDIRANTFTLFLHRSSPKWRELNRNGHYEILLYYPSCAYQFRLSGTFEETPRERILPHLPQRPATTRALDVFYQQVIGQSSPVESREWLLAELERIRAREAESGEAETASGATGIDCRVERIDMLQIATDGAPHDRRLFTLSAGAWREETLVP